MENLRPGEGEPTHPEFDLEGFEKVLRQCLEHEHIGGTNAVRLLELIKLGDERLAMLDPLLQKQLLREAGSDAAKPILPPLRLSTDFRPGDEVMFRASSGWAHFEHLYACPYDSHVALFENPDLLEDTILVRPTHPGVIFKRDYDVFCKRGHQRFKNPKFAYIKLSSFLCSERDGRVIESMRRHFQTV